MIIAYRIIAFFIGYAFGNISPGRIFAKANHVDLQKSGSGNVGSTNVARTMGMKVGVLNLICDFIKALIPAFIVFLLFKNNEQLPIKLLMTYSAFGAVLGHIFPIVFGFKGGKGIATNIGLILVMAPISLIGCLIVFFIAVIITRFVSLGSLLCAIVLPAQVWFLILTDRMSLEKSFAIEIGIIVILDAIICAYKHKENIKRLLSGTENKFGVKKEKQNE